MPGRNCNDLGRRCPVDGCYKCVRHGGYYHIGTFYDWETFIGIYIGNTVVQIMLYGSEVTEAYVKYHGRAIIPAPYAFALPGSVCAPEEQKKIVKATVKDVEGTMKELEKAVDEVKETVAEVKVKQEEKLESKVNGRSQEQPQQKAT